jgi:hypothetical protein
MLTAAGYDPHAMLDMLDAVARLDLPGDELHPSWLQRRTRVAALLGATSGGELARERYHAHVDPLTAGIDPRLLAVVDRKIVSLDVWITVSPRGEQYAATLRAPGVTDLMLPGLDEVRHTRAVGHEIVTGVMRADVDREDPSKQSIASEAIASEVATLLEPPTPGTYVAIVRGRNNDLWITVTDSDPAQQIAAMISQLHAPTADERAKLLPMRIRDVRRAAELRPASPPSRPE